jgi:hypothetical protein
MEAFEEMQIGSGFSSHDVGEVRTSRAHTWMKRCIVALALLFLVWAGVNMFASTNSGADSDAFQLLQSSSTTLNGAMLHSVVVAVIFWASASANYVQLYASTHAAAVLLLMFYNASFSLVHECLHSNANDASATLRDKMCLAGAARLNMCRLTGKYQPRSGACV